MDRENAIAILRDDHAKEAAAIQTLTFILQDESELLGFRRQAAAALNASGPDAYPAVGALNKVLTLPDRSHEALWFLIEAVKTLATIGQRAQPTVNNLVALINNKREDLHLRTDAARAIGCIGPPAKDAVEVLTKIVNPSWEDRELQTAAVVALGRLRQSAVPAIPALSKRVPEGLTDPEFFDVATTAFAEIASAITTNVASDLSFFSLKRTYNALQQAHRELALYDLPKEHLKRVRTALDIVRSEYESRRLVALSYQYGPPVLLDVVCFALSVLVFWKWRRDDAAAFFGFRRLFFTNSIPGILNSFPDWTKKIAKAIPGFVRALLIVALIGLAFPTIIPGFVRGPLVAALIGLLFVKEPKGTQSMTAKEYVSKPTKRKEQTHETTEHPKVLEP